ncbi:MAG: tetratricopeptide repeat protein [Pseudomonadota bacterium]
MSTLALQHAQEGAAHASAGRLEAAIGAYRRALALEPDHAAVHCALGIALAKRGQVNHAMAAYQQAIALAPQAAAGPYNLALLQHATGRYGEAEASLRRALALEPSLAAGHGKLALTLEALGQLEPAAEALRQALALRPGHPGDLLSLARILEKLGQPDQARGALGQALAAQPDAPPLLVAQARLLKTLGRDDEAAETARRALALQPGDLEVLRTLRVVLGEQGAAEAEAAYRTALARRPDFADGACDLAELRLAQGDAAGALAVCEDCLAATPGQTRALAVKTVALNELGETQKLARLTSQDLFVQERRWNDVGALNQELARHILAHPSLFHEPRETATRLGRHSGELLIEPKGPVTKLEAMICQAVEDYQAALKSNPFLTPPAPTPERWSLNVWAVVLEAAGYQQAHIHPSAWLSGVYYAALPALDEEQAHEAGWLEFGRPLAHHRTTVAPPTTAIRPEEGLMVLFPSYLFHRTIPFSGSGTRISIAFDVIPEGERP